MSSALQLCAVRGDGGCYRPNKCVQCSLERSGGQLHCVASVREIVGYQSGTAEDSSLLGFDDPGHWREVPEHKVVI